jgi:hypothetical protein
LGKRDFAFMRSYPRIGSTSKSFSVSNNPKNSCSMGAFADTKLRFPSSK